MAHHGKKYRAGAKLIDRTKSYSVEEAVGMLQKLPKAKYDETVEVSLKLGIDPRRPTSSSEDRSASRTASARS